MCYYNGLRVTKTEFIRLLDIEKDIRGYKDLLYRPVQKGFEYGDWPVILPESRGWRREIRR